MIKVDKGITELNGKVVEISNDFYHAFKGFYSAAPIVADATLKALYDVFYSTSWQI